MKILLDAFNLGLKQGTGLATYTKELGKILASQGHEVDYLFGLDRVSKNQDIRLSTFIQSLLIEGEPQGWTKKRLFNKFVFDLPKYLTRGAFKLKQISCDSQSVVTKALYEKIPHFNRIYNYSYIFRESALLSYIAHEPVLINCGSGYKPDVLHMTSPLPISMKGVKKVVTVHDLIPLVLPQSTSINLKNYKNFIRDSIKDADLIFSISKKTKEDLLKYFNYPEEKIVVTYENVDIPDFYKKLTEEEVRRFLWKNYRLSYKKYFLYYGAIEPKKNVRRIIEAFLRVDTDEKLVVVGKNGWLYDDVLKLLESIKKKKRFLKRIHYV
ncbi:MAG: glycosyltransferase, partial [Lactobacillaceae bacterium]|nr:glycosyltransferase [Lactobacillaceae bacterium]